METTPGTGNTTLIGRVLKLRRCMGIDNELSIADPQSGVFERSLSGLGGHDRRRLYAFTKDPDGPHDKQQKFIIQPTSLCNINCNYCYLPNRFPGKRIDTPTLSRIFEAIFSSSLILTGVEIVWHAGEPMTLPIRFYEEAFQLVEQYNTCQVPVTFTFQTNGTLLHSNGAILLKTVVWA